MGIYEIKPKSVEAILWTGLNFLEVQVICRSNCALNKGDLSIRGNPSKGFEIVSIGSWIVKHSNDDLNQMEKETFEKIYRLV